MMRVVLIEQVYRAFKIMREKRIISDAVFLEKVNKTLASLNNL